MVKANKPKILVVGSHPNSSFSMTNFTRDNFAVLTELESSFDLIFFTPLKVFSRITPQLLPKKYSVNIDKFAIFAPFLAIFLMFKQVQIVHVLDQSDSIYRLFIRSKCRFVVTVHDIFALQAASGHLPEIVKSKSGIAFARLIELGLRKSDLALAISHTTEKDLKERFGELSSRVIHNFVREVNFELTKFDKSDSSNTFLIVMSSNWRKDRIASLRVWTKLLSIPEFQSSDLTVVGNQLTNDELFLIPERFISRIHVRGNLTSIEIAELYRKSIAVINISKYEGFGLQIIEANLNGKICIYGGSAALREIGGHLNVNWDEIKADIKTSNLSDRILSYDKRVSAYEAVIRNFSAQQYVRKIYVAYSSILSLLEE